MIARMELPVFTEDDKDIIELATRYTACAKIGNQADFCQPARNDKNTYLCHNPDLLLCVVSWCLSSSLPAFCIYWRWLIGGWRVLPRLLSFTFFYGMDLFLPLKSYSRKKNCRTIKSSWAIYFFLCSLHNLLSHSYSASGILTMRTLSGYIYPNIKEINSYSFSIPLMPESSG